MLCNLNTIDHCNSSVPSVVSLLIYPFGSLRNFKYDTNLNYIESYDYTIRGVEYHCNPNSSFTETLDHNLINTYEQILTVIIPHISAEKRLELLKMSHNGYTIILKDGNGRSWLMGYDYPVRLVQQLTQTGTSSGDNLYNVTFKTTSKVPVKEIISIDTYCSAQLNSQTVIYSSFELHSPTIDASKLVDLIGNGITRTIVTNSIIDFSLWATDPIQKDIDISILNQLLNPNGNSYIFDAYWDDINYEGVLIIISTDTIYSALVIDTAYYAALNRTVLNLNTIVNTSIYNHITIELSDNNGQVFELPYGTPLTNDYVGITGRPEDLYIDLSNYAMDTTFTINVYNTIGNCSVQTFYYEHIIYESCNHSVETRIENTTTYTIEVSKFIENEAFRRFKIKIGDFVGIYLNDVSEWTSDVNIMESLFNNILYNNNTGVISHTFREYANRYVLTFVHSSNDILSYITTYTDDSTTIGTDKAISRSYPAQNDKAIVFNIQSPNDSTVNLSSPVNYGVVSGSVNTTPHFSGSFIPANINNPDVNINMSEIAIKYNKYAEDTEFHLDTGSLVCPTVTSTFKVTTCLEAVDTTSDYQQINVDVKNIIGDVLGNSMNIQLSNGSVYNLTFPFTINQYNLHLVVETVNAMPDIKLINIDYDAFAFTYCLTFRTEYGVNINSISFDLSKRDIIVTHITEVRSNSIPKQHPSILISTNGFSGTTATAVHKKAASSPNIGYSYDGSTQLLELNVGDSSEFVAANYTVNFWGGSGTVPTSLIGSIPDILTSKHTVDLNTLFTPSQLSSINFIEFVIGSSYKYLYMLISPTDPSIQTNNIALTERASIYGELGDLYRTDVTTVLTDYVRTSVNCPNEDVDALTYLYKINNTDDNIKNVINTLVANLKSNGLWNSLIAFYPILGSTASTQSWNLKNYINRPFANHLSFNGIIGNINNSFRVYNPSTFVNTHFKPLTSNLNNLMIGLKINSNSTDLTYEFGALSNLNSVGSTVGTAFQPRSINGNLMYSAVNGTLVANGTTPTPLGLYTLNRTNSTAFTVVKSPSVYNNTNTSFSGTVVSNPDLYIGCANLDGIPTSPSNRWITYFAIGNSYSSGQITTYNNIINSFLTALNK